MVFGESHCPDTGGSQMECFGGNLLGVVPAILEVYNNEHLQIPNSMGFYLYRMSVF